MKKLLPILLLIFASTSSIKAQHFNDSIAFSRYVLNDKAMRTLGTFATANIISGFILANNTSGEAKYFWRMNAYWNLANLGIAGLNLLQTQLVPLKHYSFTSNLKEQLKIEKTYVLNLGLDAGYITTGILLRSKGKVTTDINKQDRLKGYGTSIIVQGALLGVMDIVMLSLHHKNTERMHNRLNSLELTAAPGALALTYKF